MLTNENHYILFGDERDRANDNTLRDPGDTIQTNTAPQSITTQIIRFDKNSSATDNHITKVSLAGTC